MFAFWFYIFCVSSVIYPGKPNVSLVLLLGDELSMYLKSHVFHSLCGIKGKLQSLHFWKRGCCVPAIRLVLQSNYALESFTLNCYFLNGVLIFHRWHQAGSCMVKWLLLWWVWHLQAVTQQRFCDFISLPDFCTNSIFLWDNGALAADACMLTRHVHARANKPLLLLLLARNPFSFCLPRFFSFQFFFFFLLTSDPFLHIPISSLPASHVSVQQWFIDDGAFCSGNISASPESLYLSFLVV